MTTICRWCHGAGSRSIEPDCTTRYRCADCRGRGYFDPDEDEDEEREIAELEAEEMEAPQ